jgi:hypothetical protein
VSDTPLIPGSLFGLRTWRLAVDEDGEHLTGAWQRRRWPPGGAWLEAACAKDAGHAAPDPSCTCGIHAWHPRRSSARRVLASRFEVPGVVEAAGAIQLQDDGFRAQRAKPYALVVTPGRNARLVERVARRYGAEVVEVPNPDALVAWCRKRGLGLSPDTVAEILGPEHVALRRGARRRKLRRDVLGSAAAAVLSVGLLGLGLQFESGPPSPHGVYGRTGWVVRPTCPKPPAGGDAARSAASGKGQRPPSAHPC